ncbi:MAG: hypothetical protein LQ343_000133 [Gyalolechia ehrenbergii]|nr:MAG: hypothetical protein LQ343_000133 [Gyalolechia ehrenbergii]
MATLEAFLARTLTDPTRALFHLIKRRYANKDVESVTVFREVTTTHPEWARITRPPAFNPLTTPCPPPYEEYIPPTWLWNDFAFNAVWYGFILAFLLLVLWLLWNPGLPCFLGSGPGNGGPVGPGGSGGSAPGGSGPNGNGGPSGSNPGGSGAPGGSGTNGNGNGGDTGPPHAPPSAPSDPSGGFGTGGDNGSNSSPLPSGPPPPPSAPGNPSAPMNLRVPPSGDPGTSGGSGNGSVNGSSLPPAHPSFIPYNGFTPGSAPGNPTSSLPPASAPITASPAPASVSAAAHTDSFADWWIIYTIVIVLGFAIGCTSYEIPWTFAEPALASLLAVNKVHCMLFLLTHGYHLRGWYMSSLRTNYEYLTDWHHRQYHQYINEFVWKVICGKRWLVFYVPIFLSWLGDLAVEKWPFVRRFLVRVWRFICPLLQKFFTLLWDLLKLGVHNVILLYRDWRNIYGPTTEDHNAVLNENARLEKKNARLEKKNAQLQQNNGQIEERNARLEKTMHEQDQIIVQKNRKIVAQRDTIKAGRNFDQEKELDKRGVLAKALKVENSALKEQVAEANEDNSALREKVAELEVKVQKLRDESATVKTLQAAYHRLETRRDDQVQNDVEGHPVVKELRAKLQESNTQLDAAGQTEAESKSTTKALEASNQQLQAQLNAAGQTEAETQSTVKALETSNQQLQAQISADRKSALDFIQPLEHENKSLTHQLAVANLSLTFSNGETERLRGQLEAGEKARGMMSREMNELRKTMAQLQTQAQGPLPPSQPEGPLPPSQPEEPLPQTQPEVPQPEAQSPRKMAKPVGHRKRLVRPSDVPEQPPQVPSGQTNPIPVVDPVPSQGPDDTNLGPGTKPVPGVDPVPVVDPQADPPRKQKPPSGRRPRPAPKPVKPLPDPTPLSGPDPVPDPRPVPNPPAGPDPLPGQKPLPDPTPLFGPISLPGSNPPPAPTPPAGSNSLPGQKRLPGLSGFPGSIPLPVNTPLPAQNIPGPRTENPQSSTGPLSDPMDVNEVKVISKS